MRGTCHVDLFKADDEGVVREKPRAPRGASVLVLAHNFGHDHLLQFLAYAQRRAGWTLGMVADKPYPHFCEGLSLRKDDYFLLPDVGATPEWERDGAQVKLVRALVADCETKTGIPLSRVCLADDRNTGRGFGRELHHWPASALSRVSLGDNAMPERYALRWFHFADQVLNAFRPDLVIVGGQICTPPYLAFTLLVESRGIPFTINRPSKILSNRWFWTSDLEMLNRAGRDLCTQKITTGVKPGAESFDRINQFRQQPIEVAYIQHINRVVAGKGLLSELRALGSVLAERIRWWRGGRVGPRCKPILPKAQELLRSYFLHSRQAGLFKTFADEDLANFPYLYIALHKEPELALNYQAPLWHNQKNFIAWISKNLACGYRLLVRDHRRNQGRRSTSFYRDILAYPGVDLVSPLDSQFKYIRNADLILADNGTTGWEGLIFGKRVVSVARNFYEPAALAEQVRDPSKLGEIMLSRLAEPEMQDAAEWDRRLACLIEAELATTLPEHVSSHADNLRIVASLFKRDARVAADTPAI